jgi:hypothetical protein
VDSTGSGVCYACYASHWECNNWACTTLLPPSYHPPTTLQARVPHLLRQPDRRVPPARRRRRRRGPRHDRSQLRAARERSGGSARPQPRAVGALTLTLTLTPPLTPTLTLTASSAASRGCGSVLKPRTAHNPRGTAHAASPPLRLTPYSSRTAYHGTSYYSLLAGARIRQLPQFRRGRRDRTRLEPQL